MNAPVKVIDAGPDPSPEEPIRDGGRVVLRGRPFPPSAIFGFLTTLNAVAIWGQAAWFHERITNHNGPEDWAVPLLVALVIEMIGVYLSGMAHAALMADQSAGMLRLGSYGIGALVGGLNYWHFAGPGYAPTPAAVTFGALSTISPWLWAIYSRFMNRDRLAELGLIDKRGVKLSINRKLWHPIRSLRVMSFASWEGITNPDEAVRAWELARQRPEAPVSPAPAVADLSGNDDLSPDDLLPPTRFRTPAAFVAAAERLHDDGMAWDAAAERLGITARTLYNYRQAIARQKDGVA